METMGKVAHEVAQAYTWTNYYNQIKQAVEISGEKKQKKLLYLKLKFDQT